MAALLRIIARRPVLAFMVIGLGPYFLIVAIPPIVNAEILPFDLPLHGVLGGVLGVGVGAFLVTGALTGHAGGTAGRSSALPTAHLTPTIMRDLRAAEKALADQASV